MIQNMDIQKNQYILNTFQKLSKTFTLIFKNLIPSGVAELTLDKDSNDDFYSGLSINVSFNSDDLKQTIKSNNMNQLSGGQKTIVALAFIFAMQQCDPAPFYLFDEIDQALDPQYRLDVASFISIKVFI